MGVKRFFRNLLGGALMGTAMIIPGVSGGTVAVLLGMYNELIEAVSGLKKHFGASVSFLFPVLLGAIAAFAAMYFPLNFALERAPFPTVALFAGLMSGSLPKLIGDSRKEGFKRKNILSAAIPFAVIIAVCCLKLCVSAGDADLSSGMEIWGYFAVFGVAALASCALVIPGVSGSMLLMLMGYYAPVLALFKGLATDFAHSALVLALFAAGLIAGFFSVALLMKYFLTRFRRGTSWAITGFVLGSVPAIFIVFDYSTPTLDGIQAAAAIILFALGAIGTYFISSLADKKKG